MARKKSLLATAAERIVLYLMDYRSYAGELDGPIALTQAGIGDAIGMARPNVPRVISRLIGEDVVGTSKVHVAGIRLKRTVYFLTEYGRIRARALRERILSADIIVKFPDGSTERMPVGEAVRLVPAELRLVDVVREANETLTFDVEAFLTSRLGSALPDSIRSYADTEHFCGRERELAAIREWVNLPGKRVLVIQGMPGIGKTTMLCRALAPVSGYKVHYHKIQRWSNLRSVVGALAEFFRENDSPQLSGYLDEEPAIGLPELEVVLASVFDGPMKFMLVYDDFHNAGPDLLDFFAMMRGLLEGSENTKLVVIGRMVEPFYDIPALSIRGSVTEMLVKGLDGRDSRRLAKSLGIESDTLDSVAEQTGGHPLFIELVARGGGDMGQGHDIERYIREEFASSLGPEELDLLKYLSVYRYPVVRASLRTRQRILDSLLRRSVIRLQNGSVMIHDIVRECFYGQLSERELGAYHRRAAEYYLERSDPASLFEAAHHLIRAEEWDAAGELLADQGNLMLSSGKLAEMVKLIAAVLSRSSAPDRKHGYDRLLYLQARALYLMGQWDDAMEHFRRVIEIVGDADADISLRANMGMAEIMLSRSSYRAARGILEDTMERAREIEGTEPMLADLEYHLGSVYVREGNIEMALREFSESRDLARNFGNRMQQARALYGIGRVQHREGRYDEAVASRRKALEMSLQIGDKHTGAKILTGIGWTFSEMGKVDEALESHARAADMARECGSVRTLAYALSNLGAVYIDKRHLDKAQDCLTEAGGIFEKLGETRMRATVLVNRAVISMLRGRHDVAAVHLKEAVRVLKEAGDMQHIIAVYFNYSRSLLEAGENDAARKYGKKALALARELGDGPAQEKIQGEILREG